jgi:Ca2+-binding RTX toxin-like protein
MAIIVGNNLNNNLPGTILNDIIAGQAGNDILSGSFGNDVLRGGVGNDLLNGGLGTDTADYSNAVLDPTGPAGPVLTIGAVAGVNVNLNLLGVQNTVGAGLDQLVSIENVTGTNFNDSLTGNAANNVLSGLAGNDVLSGNAGNDTLLGGTGNDLLIGGTGNDTLNGGTGIDTASYVGAGPVTVNLNLGLQNTGGGGIDNLVLGTIENLTGSNFNDTLIGNAANNVLLGSNGNDILLGNAGNDTLNGGLGNDNLNGGLNVGIGRDFLTGGAGRDVLTGFGGALAFDTFDYNAASESGPGVLNRDVITDFNGRGALVGDQIDLSTIDANLVLAGNQAFGAGQLTYVGGILSANIIGTPAVVDLQIQLLGAPPLVLSDIVL